MTARGRQFAGYPEGYFVFPTILDGVPPQGEIARTEIFGPVLSLMHAATMDEAIALVNERSYGNMACLFTSDGANARASATRQCGQRRHQRRRRRAHGLLPVQRLGESFFGDLHAQAEHGVEFYTQTKVVVERWPRDWSRRF